uniref:C2H2-type domain-containing protein n=1 Tax=Haemonchus contortus TaxID=6289 RepID=A0A7I4Y0Z2_HAECO
MRGRVFPTTFSRNSTYVQINIYNTSLQGLREDGVDIKQILQHIGYRSVAMDVPILSPIKRRSTRIPRSGVMNSVEGFHGCSEELKGKYGSEFEEDTEFDENYSSGTISDDVYISDVKSSLVSPDQEDENTCFECESSTTDLLSKNSVCVWSTSPKFPLPSEKEPGPVGVDNLSETSSSSTPLPQNQIDFENVQPAGNLSSTHLASTGAGSSLWNTFMKSVSVCGPTATSSREVDIEKPLQCDAAHASVNLLQASIRAGEECCYSENSSEPLEVDQPKDFSNGTNRQKTPTLNDGDEIEVWYDTYDYENPVPGPQSASDHFRKSRSSSPEHSQLTQVTSVHEEPHLQHSCDASKKEEGYSESYSCLLNGEGSKIQCHMPRCTARLKWKARYGKSGLLDHVRLHWAKARKHCRICDFKAITSRRVHHHHKLKHPGVPYKGATSAETHEDVEELLRFWSLCFPGFSSRGVIKGKPSSTE